MHLRVPRQNDELLPIQLMRDIGNLGLAIYRFGVEGLGRVAVFEIEISLDGRLFRDLSEEVLPCGGAFDGNGGDALGASHAEADGVSHGLLVASLSNGGKRMAGG